MRGNNIHYNDITDTERYYIFNGSKGELRKLAKDVRFSNAQLEIIRYGIECGIDYKIYANPEIPEDIMNAIFNCLNHIRNFSVRYLDNDKVICFAYYKTHTKAEALDKFYEEYPDRKDYVLDIRES